MVNLEKQRIQIIGASKAIEALLSKLFQNIKRRANAPKIFFILNPDPSVVKKILDPKNVAFKGKLAIFFDEQDLKEPPVFFFQVPPSKTLNAFLEDIAPALASMFLQQLSASPFWGAGDTARRHLQFLKFAGRIHRGISYEDLFRPQYYKRHFGINALTPHFLEREVWEISALPHSDLECLDKVMRTLAKDYVVVQDQIGMVTLRVLAMIINEAFWLLQEGHADAESINVALRLGVNYPYGPIEWAEQIGYKVIVEVLEGLAKELGSETYRIAPLLKQKAREQL